MNAPTRNTPRLFFCFLKNVAPLLSIFLRINQKQKSRVIRHKPSPFIFCVHHLFFLLICTPHYGLLSSAPASASVEKMRKLDMKQTITTATNNNNNNNKDKKVTGIRLTSQR